MRARDVMTSPPITVGPETPVNEVAELLLEKRISAVPVVDGSGAILGIVSEGDLLRRADAGTEKRKSRWLELLLDKNVAAADFVKTHGNRASDVMTADVVSVPPDADVADIAALLERKRIKRVPVVENGRLVGIVSRANLLHGLVARSRVDTTGRGQSDDATIRAGIDKALATIHGVDLRRVNVVVTDGTVFLFGSVKSDIQRRALIVAAEGVKGVGKVEDNLNVNTFPGTSG